MSNKYLNLAWEYTAKNSGQKVVLLCLADHANDDGTCWPGVERIAEKTGMKERMVQNHLRDLENSGVIFVEKNKGMKTATGWTNRYTLTFKGCNAVPQGVYYVAPLNQQGVQCSTNKGCNAVPQGVQPTAPKPHRTNINHNGSEKPPRRDKSDSGEKENYYPMAKALADICQKDMTVISGGEKAGIFRAAKKMTKNGYSPNDIKDFGRWWFGNDWRGKQGQPPNLSQVSGEWGRYKASKKPANVDLAAKEYQGRISL